jgi:glucarate dehydratase
MKIKDIRMRTVTIPIEAPTLHSYAAPDAFTKNIIEVFTDAGITGFSETFADVKQDHINLFKPFLIGADPFDLEKIRIGISQFQYITRHFLLLSAIEFACYDIQGKALNLPVYKLLGGKIRDKVDTAAYLFYRYNNEKGYGKIHTPREMVDYTEKLIKEYGFKTLKLKAGVYDPEHEVKTIAALRKKFGSEYKIRIDPNGIWDPATAIRMGQKLLPYDLEYYEDPTWGLPGLAQVSKKVNIPIASNMAVTEFENLGPAISLGAVDIILSDPWYWGGMYYTKILDFICKHLGVGVGFHSGVEFGIGLSIMLHVASTMPNLVRAIDSHYHHLTDDIIKGPMLKYKDGAMSVPEGPGLGVELDEDKMKKYSDLNKKLSSTNQFPRDKKRPDWLPKVPAW